MSFDNPSGSTDTPKKTPNNAAEKKQEVRENTQADLQNLIVENRIKFYDEVIGSISLRLRQVNADSKRDISMVAGIGNFIGEKTGLYEGGDTIFSRGEFEPIVKYAKEAQAQILADFAGKNLSPSQGIAIRSLRKSLGDLTNSKLDPVTWKRAILTTLNIDKLPGTDDPQTYSQRWLTQSSEFIPIGSIDQGARQSKINQQSNHQN